MGVMPDKIALFVHNIGGLAVVPIPASYRPLIYVGAVILLLAALMVILLRFPAATKHAALWLWNFKLALFGIAAAAAGATWAYQSYVSRPVGAPSSFLVVGEWPLDRGGLCRLGGSSDVANLRLGARQWTYDRRGEAFYSSPAVAGGYVFAVGSRDDRGRIYCFDQRSGDVVWSCSPLDYRATFSSPVITGEFLYCGEGLHHARQSRVVCIDLRAGRAGKLAWSFRTNGHVECSPVVVGGRVYFGAGDDGIYCLDGANVIDGSPRVVFHLPGEEYPDAETSLVVHDGRVYAGLGVGGHALCVLDAETGAEVKRLAMPYPVFSPPSIDRGKLYLGMGEGDYVTPDKTPAGQVCCLDLAALSIDWTYAIPGTVLGCVAVDGERLYFGGSDGLVYCLTTAGELVAKFDCRAPLLSSPAVAGQVLFVVNQAGTLICLDLQTLKPRGDVSLGAGGRFISSPVVAGDRIFVGTEKHGFKGLNLAAAEQ